MVEGEAVRTAAAVIATTRIKLLSSASCFQNGKEDSISDWQSELSACEGMYTFGVVQFVISCKTKSNVVDSC